MLGKLVNGKIEYAPRLIVVDEYTYYNPSEERLKAAGYKPIEDNPPEVDEDNPKTYAVSYEEQPDKIVAVYTEGEPPDYSAEFRTSKIAELKQALADTDYISCKIAEGSSTREEYTVEIKQRQMWRKQINDLESNNMYNYYMHSVENNDLTIGEVPEKYREDVKKMIFIKNGPQH